jgi:hypothetical protein
MYNREFYLQKKHGSSTLILGATGTIAKTKKELQLNTSTQTSPP